MCGICGIAMPTGGSTPSRAMIERMCDCIAHRGPDDHGAYFADSVALGHRRLSIVDLAHGQQPMTNEDRTCWISFNGEIYNHAELRAGLVAKGHQYQTASDTESILHLYEEEGPAGFTALRGMFAFAIWNDKEQTLVLGRDHSGIKPLYYALTAEGELLFGSEVKALFASGLLTAQVDTEVLPEYFATGHVSGERTLLLGVQKLPPGHWLTWRRGALRMGRFWSLPERPAAAGDAVQDGMEETAAEFWRRFVESVESQLMSDVPLGAFLSGGLDSSLMVAAMTHLGVQNIETFSVGYADRDANELPFARVVASLFKTRHHEVELSATDFLNGLPRLTWHRDFPLTFPASVPLAAVAEAASGHVKVVLTGEGSDELFAGYGRYPRALINLRWGGRLDRRLPAAARKALRMVAGGLGDGFVGSRVRRSFLAQEGSVVGAFLEPFSDFGATDRLRLLDSSPDPFARLVSMVDLSLLERDPLEALLRLDQSTYLEELLMKQDTMSMAASIESRVPFLDHLLREWASQIPSHLKLAGWTGKALVRVTAMRHLPPGIVEARKRGFPVPLARWFRLPAGREMLETFALADMRDTGLRREFPRQLASEHMAGRDHSSKLWRLLAFGLWMRDTLPRLQSLTLASGRPGNVLASDAAR